MTSLPENALGADLLWWRTSDGMRTTVTVLWPECRPFSDELHLSALLFNDEGEQIAAWPISLQPGQPVFIDSASNGPWQAGCGRDGLLALYACTDGEPGEEARRTFNRLCPLLDWRSSDGRVVSLHSDQVVRRGRSTPQSFTEIVALESEAESNALVLLNGEERQAAESLEITVKNSAGESRSAKYAAPMQPFTVHKIALATIFPGLAAFSAGEPLLVSGTFASSGLFSRPYVETTGDRWGAYHGGDVYSWKSLAHFAHVLISGEVNPVAVLHDKHTRTFVNLLHSHGDLDADIWVSAALFDLEGRCVARRPNWRLVRRHALARFDISELLPDPETDFRGHIALSFAAEPGQEVPRRLQALLEYRCGQSVARTMAWSDEWNSRVRLAKRDRRVEPLIGKSYFRVIVDPEATTEVSITNAGHDGYTRTAEVTLTLFDAEGPIAKTAFTLAPFATLMAPIEQLFPEAMTLLASAGLGTVVAESASDLANIAFTWHRASGALAAEHFMAIPASHDGRVEWPSGS